MVAQHLREGIVLLVGHLQIRDVVKKQLFQGVRREIEQFPAGPVKEHFFQRFDFACNMNAFHDRKVVS